MFVVPAIVFVLLEIALAVFGVGYPTSFLVRSKDGLKFVDNYRFAWRFFPQQLARTPQPVVIPTTQTANTRTIVVLGGSAAMGDPEPAFGMPRILQVLLTSRFPEIPFHVINAGVTAVNSHVVLSIADDCQVLQPDAWIIYLGNNEVHGPFGAGTVFGNTDTPRWMIRSGLAIQQTRLGQTLVGLRSSGHAAPQQWGGMEMFLESQVAADSPTLPRVYQNYQTNLRDILRITSKHDAVTVLTTVGTNLRDSPPFASAHSEAFGQSGSEAWNSAFASGCQSQDEGDITQASEYFQRAHALDAGHAELLYRYALCKSALGERDQARELFVAARDRDSLRFRADSTVNQTIRSVAEQFSDRNVRLVDFERQLQEQSLDGAPGAEFFHEHVHLNFHGNYLLAKHYATKLTEAWSLASSQDRDSDWLSEAECERKLGFSIWHQIQLDQEMQSRLSTPPFTQQCFQSQRLAGLQRHAATLSASLTADVRDRTLHDFQTQTRERPGDWVLHEVYAQLLESVGQLERATSEFEQITQLLPHRPEGHYQLGRLLNKQKKWEQAEIPLRRALEVRPNFARAANSLGIALSQQRDFDQAIAWFQKAIELQPSFGEASYNWGLVLAEQGNKDAAMQRFQQAVTQDPRYYPAHDRLAKTYVSQQQWQKAVPHYEAVARLQPFSLNPQLNLGLLYAKLVDGDPRSEYVGLAIEQFGRVVQLDPQHEYAKSALQHLRGFQVDEAKTTAE